MNIHPIFHVGLLKPYVGKESDSKPLPQPDTSGEYEIEKILGHRKRRDGKYRYLVKWRGYSYEESTWEPSSNFKSKTLQAYHRERKERKANESGSSSDEEPVSNNAQLAPVGLNKGERERENGIRRPVVDVVAIVASIAIVVATLATVIASNRWPQTCV